MTNTFNDMCESIAINIIMGDNQGYHNACLALIKVTTGETVDLTDEGTAICESGRSPFDKVASAYSRGLKSDCEKETAFIVWQLKNTLRRYCDEYMCRLVPYVPRVWALR